MALNRCLECDGRTYIPMQTPMYRNLIEYLLRIKNPDVKCWHCKSRKLVLAPNDEQDEWDY